MIYNKIKYDEAVEGRRQRCTWCGAETSLPVMDVSSCLESVLPPEKIKNWKLVFSELLKVDEEGSHFKVKGSGTRTSLTAVLPLLFLYFTPKAF